MSHAARHGLFSVTGVELEYMVVDRDTLRVRPIVDRLFEAVAGRITSDVERGDIDWSNELVAHVVELKTARPTRDLGGWGPRFHAEIVAIDETLAGMNACLLPTAAHPFMDPFTETTLWPHEYSEVYALYNRIFDCRGHGWSNLQSMHLNLPFADDDEFGRLHAAIRPLLPLIPALTASSPLLDGTVTGWLDSRMDAYLRHQERLPPLMGALIPEAVFDEATYTREIFDPIMAALAPFDTGAVMDRYFANSRGAIARFDRGAVEIRVIDLQECPSMDLAVAELVVTTIRALVEGRWSDPADSRALDARELLAVLRDVIRTAGATLVTHAGLLAVFGLDDAPRTAGAVWSAVYERLADDLSAPARAGVERLLDRGCLAERILRRTGAAPSHDRIVEVYGELAVCLRDDTALA